MKKFTKSKVATICTLLVLILLIGNTTLGMKVALADTQLKGVALKSSTNVYESKSRSSKVLKSYNQGSILLYQEHDSNWYEATVILNSKRHIGYIHKSDVETSVNNQKDLRGVALQNSTAVYSRADTSSKKLKTYKVGSILKYKSFTSNWYEATVIINRKPQQGYIHKSHVDNAVENQENLKGLALKNPTTIYSSTDLKSKRLKSYKVGRVLQYRTFTSEWYEATTILNNKPHTGYIHKSHVEEEDAEKESFRGVALANPTRVYSEASIESSTLKSYSTGSILSYRSFSKNWYEATVIIKNKPRTGYIHKSHVDNAVKNQVDLRGIGLKSPTTVYGSASTSSKKLKSYAQGRVLQYKTFSSNWYQATVVINGKPTTGYIHTSHVEGAYETNQSLEGVGLKSPTIVYSRASKNASALKSYKKGSYLLFETFSPNWYRATVYVSGKPKTGYIHRSDVNTDRILATTTTYPIDFNRVVDIQMAGNPQVSGQNGGWVDASREQVEYYVNSSNFSRNSTNYFQFLVLSQHASLNANEVNQKILNNHGILTGKAKAFIDAGKKHNINEAYLISHALLETGNGKSTLARGVPVDGKGNVVSASRAVHTVYNMYGIGAVDSDPLGGGAKRAFNEGWFTPEDAIIGGAEFISSYITRGQDTLYKMRWNPRSPGYPQYATDVAWATKQTYNISRIYSLLDRYVLIYDVPRYIGQPSSSGNPNHYKIQPRMMMFSTMSIFSSEINEEVEEIESVETSETVESVETSETSETDEAVETVETSETDEVVESDEASETDGDIEPVETSETDEEVESEETLGSEEQQIYGVVSAALELREAPNDLDSEVYTSIPEGTKLEITAIDGTWYETTYDGEVGWVNGDHVTLLNLIVVLVEDMTIYKEPNADSNDPVAIVDLEAFLVAILDEDDTIIQQNEWYKVFYNGEEGWINGGENGTEYIKIK